MELKKIQQSWNNFPEMSMEERPILSSDLEKIVVANPFPAAFYLKNKLMARILAGIILWLIAIVRLRAQWKNSGNDLYPDALLVLLLSYFIYFHIRLLLFANYASILSFPLVSFLNRIEAVMDKYIFAFMIASALAGFYLLAAFGKVLSLFNNGAYAAIDQNGFYKWLIIIFLSVSFYIFLLNTVILKYKRILAAVRVYKGGMGVKSQKL